MMILPPKKRRYDGIALLALTAIAIYAGLSYLNQWQGPVACDQSLGTWLLEPAAMMACGKGFTLPEAEQAAQLQPFLRHEKAHFSKQDLSENAALLPAESFHIRHKYAIMLIGLLWRLFGLSWGPIHALLILLLLLTGLLSYFLCRQLTGPLASFFVAMLYISSPLMLRMLPWYRDFSKAPFFLACLLLIALLLSRELSRRRFLSCATLLGVVIGLGLGFRHDIIICLPPSLAIVAFSPRPSQSWAVLERSLGVILLLTAYFALSAPLRAAYDESGTPSHDILMGCETHHELSMGMEAASYEDNNVFHDLYVLAQSTAHARRSTGNQTLIGDHSHAYNSAGWNRLEDILKTFPADMLTRGYATLFYTLSHAPLAPPVFLTEHSPFTPYVQRITHALQEGLWRFAFLATLLVLLSIASKDLYRASLFACLLLYFGSYTCLLHEERHFFHLTLLPLLFTACVLQQSLKNLSTIRRAGITRFRHPNRLFSLSSDSTKLRRISIALLTMVLVLTLPLFLLRCYQRHRVEELLQHYESVELETINTQKGSAGAWLCFRPTDPLASHQGAFFDYTGASDLQSYNSSCDYLVAEFKSKPGPRLCRINYFDSSFGTDYTWTAYLGPSGNPEQGVSRFFFPVFEQPSLASAAPPSCFEGIAVPQEYADEFLGLYRVRRQQDFRLWISFWIPADKSLIRPVQRLRLWKSREKPAWWPDQPPLPPNWDQGSREMLQEKPQVHRRSDSIQDNLAAYMAQANSSAAAGKLAEAISLYQKAIALSPYLSAPYEKLDALLEANMDPEDRIARWRQIIASGDRGGNAQFCLARAYMAQGNYPQAHKALRKAHALNPLAPAIPWEIGRNFAAEKKWKEALSAYRNALTLSPFKPFLLQRDIARAMAAQGHLGEATRYYIAALKQPGSSSILQKQPLPDFLFHSENQRELPAADQELNATIASFRKTVQERPKDRTIRDCYFHLLQIKALLLQQNKEAQALLELYREMLQLNTNNTPALTTQGIEDLLQSEAPEEALQLYQESIEKHPDWRSDLDSTLKRIKKSYLGALEKKIEALREEGKLSTALSLAQQSEAHLPEDTSLLRIQATLLEEMNQPEKGKEYYRLAIARNPETSKNYEELAALYLGQDDLDGLIKEWRSITEKAPDNSQAYYYLGSACEKNGDQPESIRAYAKAYELGNQEPKTQERYSKALNEMSRNLEKKGDLQGALSYAKQSARVAKNDAALIARQAKLLAQLGDTNQAKDLYRDAIALAPNNRKHYEDLSALYRKNGDADALSTEWLNILEKHPQSCAAHFYLADAYEAKDELDAALISYEKAYALGCTDQAIVDHYHTALLHKTQWLESQGALLEALSILEQNIVPSPENPMLLAAQAKLLSQLNRNEEATVLYRRTLLLDPGAYSHYEALSAHLNDHATLEAIIREWRSILRENPDLPAAHFCLGVACEKQGELDSAITAYKTAYEMGSTGQATRERYAAVLNKKAQELETQKKPEQAREMRRKAKELLKETAQ